MNVTKKTLFNIIRHVCAYTQSYMCTQNFKQTLNVQVWLDAWLQSKHSTNASEKKE